MGLNNELWTAVSAIASAVAAIAALLTIMQAVAARRMDREGRCSYFRVIVEDVDFPVENVLNLTIDLINAGGHPAKDISLKLVMTDFTRGNAPLIDKEYTIANELAQEGKFTITLSSVTPIPIDTPAQDILLAIKYTDVVLNKICSQKLFFWWKGMIEGKPSKTLSHAVKGREQLETTFSEYIKAWSC